MVEVEWSRMTAEALRRLAESGATVVLPVASTEQHGPHLATGVDALLCGEVARRAAMRVARETPVVVAPTLWCGLADHHMAFGGTFTLSFATYHALLRDLCGAILHHGFRRVLMLNGHGGNVTGLNVVANELMRELGAPVAVTSYWMLADGAFREILEDQESVLHACEAETSMMMALAPDLVDRSRLGEAVGPPMERAGSVLYRPLHRWRSFAEITRTGVIGDARRADAAKGELLLDAAAAALAESLRRGEPWEPSVPDAHHRLDLDGDVAGQ